jgi:hypothetical protein
MPANQPPPLPPAMTDAEARRALNYACDPSSGHDTSDRLMLEILDARRSIDDKLDRLLQAKR